MIKKFEFTQNEISGNVEIYVQLCFGLLPLFFQDEISDTRLPVSIRNNINININNKYNINNYNYKSKKIYMIPFCSVGAPKYTRVMINDPRIRLSNNIDDIKDQLLKLKGFVRVQIDITKQFNQFQERLKDELESLSDYKDSNNFNNRKYFTNCNKETMPYLQWDKKNDTIKYNHYVMLNDANVIPFHFQQNYLQCLKTECIIIRNNNNNNHRPNSTVFWYLLSFVDAKFVRPVCREWMYGFGVYTYP